MIVFRCRGDGAVAACFVCFIDREFRSSADLWFFSSAAGREVTETIVFLCMLGSEKRDSAFYRASECYQLYLVVIIILVMKMMVT